MLTTLPSASRPTVTSTGPPKPWAVAVKVSSAGASSGVGSGSGVGWAAAASPPRASFTACITALLVMVAPDSASMPSP